MISLNDVNIGGQNIVLGTFMNHINVDSRVDNIILYENVSNITIGYSKNIIIRSSCSNIEIRDSCENIYIGAGSGDNENGFIKISNNCHNIILPALTAQNGQVIIESNCGSQGGSLVVESKCA